MNAMADLQPQAPSPPVSVAIDVGAGALEASAVDADGTVCAAASSPYETSVPRPGWCEQRPDDWWQACRAAMLALGTQIDLERVTSVGVTGQTHATVLLDAERDVIRPAMLRDDQRAAAESDEIERIIGLERLVRISGGRSSAALAAPRLIWLRRHATIAYKRLHHVLAAKDYVRLKLTGEIATDVSDAAATGLFDVAGHDWSSELIDALDLDRSVLPPTLESAAVAGRLLPDVAADLGLPPGIAVMARR